MPIISQIVNRAHVSDSNLFVIKCVAEHMREGRRTFFALPKETRRALMREAIRTHEENRQLYADVMSGNLGGDEAK